MPTSDLVKLRAKRARYEASHPERNKRPDRHLKARQERRPSPYALGKFVSVDGEGVYRETAGVGPQEYALLSDSTGRYIWSSDPHLSTNACLEFLLDIPRRLGPSIVFGFGLNYDVAHWLRDIGTARWKRLLRHKSVWFGPYDVEWVPRKWFSVRIREGPRVGEYVRVEDVLSNFNQTFVKTVDEWLGPQSANPILAKGKAERGEHTVADKQFLIEYNREELRLAVELMGRFKQARDAVGIRSPYLYSPAVMSKEFIRRNHTKDCLSVPESYVARKSDEVTRLAAALGKCDPTAEPARYSKLKKALSRALRESKRPTHPDVIDLVARTAFFGGHIESAGFGRAHARIYNVDINSAYPFALTLLPNFLRGTWTHEKGAAVKWTPTFMPQSISSRRSLLRVRWDFRRTPRRFYPFPIRDEKGSVFFPPCFTGWYWDVEVSAAILRGDFPAKSIEILEAYHFTPTDPDERPFAWVADLYLQRQDWKDKHHPAEKVLKLALNAVFGATCQQISMMGGQLPPLQDMLYAGLITATTRALIYALVRTNEDAIVSVATDGVYSLSPFPSSWSEVFGYAFDADDSEAAEADMLPTALGNFKTEIYEDMTTLQSGVYRVKHAEGCACRKHGPDGWEVFGRGFGGAAVPFDQIESAWARRDATLEYALPKKRFVGPRLALARGEPDEALVWEKKTRTIPLNEFGTKRAAVAKPELWNSLKIAPESKIEWTKPEYLGFVPTYESRAYAPKVSLDDAREIQEELFVDTTEEDLSC